MENQTTTSGIEIEDRTIPATPVVRGQTVDAEGAARATADEAAAAAAGFAMAPPIYTIGTMVVDTGVENFKASRLAYEAMPLTSEACDGLAAAVANEHRSDKKVALPELLMIETGHEAGHLHTNGNGTYPMTRRAMEGLASFLNPSNGGGFLRDIDADLRAKCVNRLLARGYRLDKRANDAALAEYDKACLAAIQAGTDTPKYPAPVMVPREVTLRTRDNAKFGREVFSTVGPRYGEYDIDKIARQVAGAVPEDSRCDITYDGYKARINVLFHSNVQAEKVVAGEIFKAGLLVKTADDGSGSIQISAQMWRNLCLNLIIIDFKNLLVGSRRHIGTGLDIQASVAEHMQVALNKVDFFAQKWGEGTVEKVLERYASDGITDMESLFTRLVTNKVVAVPGVKRPDLVGRLMAAWEKEPVATKTGVLNAITRMAHEETWKTWETAEELERKAGELLFVQKSWDMVDKTTDDPFASL